MASNSIAHFRVFDSSLNPDEPELEGEVIATYDIIWRDNDGERGESIIEGDRFEYVTFRKIDRRTATDRDADLVEYTALWEFAPGDAYTFRSLHRCKASPGETSFFDFETLWMNNNLLEAVLSTDHDIDQEVDDDIEGYLPVGADGVVTLEFVDTLDDNGNQVLKSTLDWGWEHSIHNVFEQWAKKRVGEATHRFSEAERGRLRIQKGRLDDENSDDVEGYQRGGTPEGGWE